MSFHYVTNAASLYPYNRPEPINPDIYPEKRVEVVVNISLDEEVINHFITSSNIIVVDFEDSEGSLYFDKDITLNLLMVEVQSPMMPWADP